MQEKNIENELPIQSEGVKINSFELLANFVSECKKIVKEDNYYPTTLCSADILTAVYYYRLYPDVEYFIKNVFKFKNNYFQLQWVRSIWDRFSNMTEAELSDLVINQITLVAKLAEEQ